MTPGPASLVLDQAGVAAAPVHSVGAKAAALARLADAGLPVPPFAVVTSSAFARHLSQSGVSWPPGLAGLGSGHGAGAGPAWSHLRARILETPMDRAVARQLLDAADRLGRASGHRRVAVRSSGSEEDSPTASFAGQFRTLLNVDQPSLEEGVKQCWASYLSDRSRGYRSARRVPFGPSPGFGVIVQVQVFSRAAGVAFTVHPLEGGGELMYIEANFGTGESVVGGLVTPDRAAVSRLDPDAVDMVTATKRRMTSVSRAAPGTTVVEIEDEATRAAPVLRPGEVSELVQVGLRIERLMGRPQDIEWAYDDAQLWILQARPIPDGPPGGA